MCVEHDGGGQARHRCPGTRSAADHDGQPARASAHSARGRGGRVGEPGREPLRPPGRRDEHQRRCHPGARTAGSSSDREHEVDEIGDGRQSHDASHPARRATGPSRRGRRSTSPSRSATSVRPCLGAVRAASARPSPVRPPGGRRTPGPAQRHAAHSASSTTAGGGPQPSHDLRGRRSTPACARHVAPRPPSRAPNGRAAATRTRVPTRTSCPHSVARRSRTSWAAPRPRSHAYGGGRPRRRIGLRHDALTPRTRPPQGSAPAIRVRARTAGRPPAGVASHVNSFSERPK